MSIESVDVYKILPVHNAGKWLNECLQSIQGQTFKEGKFELSIFNDASKDDSITIINSWKDRLSNAGIHVIVNGHSSDAPKGVGFAKNQAVANSRGAFLCFQDAGTPEDLLFFLKHLELGGGVYRVDENLLTYRYHPDCATHSVHRDTIWDIRIEAIQKRVINQWKQFTIWNAGKEGRKFYRSLTQKNKAKVKAFCDVDAKKIGKVYTYEGSKEQPKPTVPIVHFSDASPPFVICVKMDLTKGGLECNIASLNLVEGKDYYFFS